MDDIYYQKYLKYKNKYLELQKLSGGDELSDGIKTIMSDMDKHKNDIKKAIDAFLKTLTPEQQKDIPKDKTFGTTDDYQIFRFRIYFFVKYNITPNYDLYEKLRYFKIDHIKNLIDFDLNKDDMKRILNLDTDILRFNKQDIEKILKLGNEDIPTLLYIGKHNIIKHIINLEPVKIKNILNKKDIFNMLKKIDDFDSNRIESILKLEFEQLHKLSILLIDKSLLKILQYIRLPDIYLNKLLNLDSKYLEKILFIHQQHKVTAEQIIYILNLEQKYIQKILDFENIIIKQIVDLNLKPAEIKYILELEENIFKKIINLRREKIIYILNLKPEQIKYILELEEHIIRQIIYLKPEQIIYILNLEQNKIKFLVELDILDISDINLINKEQFIDIINFRNKKQIYFDKIYNKIKNIVPSLKINIIFNILHKIRNIADIKFKESTKETDYEGTFYSKFIKYFIPNYNKIDSKTIDQIFNKTGDELQTAINEKTKLFRDNKTTTDTDSTSSK